MTDTAVFRRTRTIQAGDTDDLGHVNNVTWVRMVVELADAHSSDVGLDQRTTQNLGGAWIVRRHEIEYHLPAEAGQTVHEETWIEEMRGARCRRASRFRTPSGELLLTATTDWVFFDATTGRPRRTPQAILDRFTAVGQHIGVSDATPATG